MQELKTIHGEHAERLAHSYLLKVEGYKTSSRPDVNGTTYFDGSKVIGVLEGEGITILDGPEVRIISMQEMQDALSKVDKGSTSFHMDQKEYDSLKAMADGYDFEYEGLGEPLTEFAARRILEKLPLEKLTQLVSAIRMAERHERHTSHFYMARDAQRRAEAKAFARSFEEGNKVQDDFDLILPIGEATAVFEAMSASELGPFLQQVYAAEYAMSKTFLNMHREGGNPYKSAALKALQSK